MDAWNIELMYIKIIISIIIPTLILCAIVWFYYPMRVAFTVEMPEKEMLDTGEGDYTGETARVDVTLSLQRRLLSNPKVTGNVTIDGVSYDLLQKVHVKVWEIRCLQRVLRTSHVDLARIPDESIMFYFVREAVEGTWACCPSLNDITVQLRKSNDEIIRYRVPLSEIQPLEK